MKPGDLVTLPDGRQGYFQEKSKSGDMLVLVFESVPAAEAKKVKVVK